MGGRVYIIYIQSYIWFKVWGIGVYIFAYVYIYIYGLGLGE